MTGIHQLLLTNFDASGGGVGELSAFSADGTFTVPSGITSFRYLVIGGGGAGAGNHGGGGGAAQELRHRLPSRGDM